MSFWNNWFFYIKKYICFYDDKLENNKKYLFTKVQYELIKKIKNQSYMELEELNLLKIFSKEQLLEIIEIINTNTKRINEIILYMDL